MGSNSLLLTPPQSTLDSPAMESKPEESVRAKMELLRLACGGEVAAQHQTMDALTAAIRNSLVSIRATAEETVKSRGKVREVKSKLREAEDDLFKALAVKTRKEAKRMALMDAIVARKARIEEIRRAVQDQRDKRDGYAVILSQQFSESEEEDCNQISKDEVKEAVSWYNKVLGLNIEGGHGVRFTFENISLKDPDKEFSFIVRHANDTYTLLDCVPHINETKDMIHDLNKTNGLFKFVRDIRLQFQEAAAEGLSSVLPQESSSISDSAPALSVSTERSESLAKIYEHQFQYEEVSRQFKKPNHGMGSQAAIFSPGSASSLRQSPRFKVKK